MPHLWKESLCQQLLRQGRNTTGKKADKAEETPKKESPPTKATINLTIEGDWGTTPNMGA